MLAVTGAEGPHADMGHFDRGPITRVWLLIVFPACILSYLGRDTVILDNPVETISNPFYLLVPEWGQVPMIVFAAAATVIASQAVITGAFSIARQAAQLGYLPRRRIAHTSEDTIGQVYVPWIDWALLVSVGQSPSFLSTIELCRGDAPGMSRWRKRLFVATSPTTADYVNVPREMPRDRRDRPAPPMQSACLHELLLCQHRAARRK